MAESPGEGVEVAGNGYKLVAEHLFKSLAIAKPTRVQALVDCSPSVPDGGGR